MCQLRSFDKPGSGGEAGKQPPILRAVVDLIHPGRATVRVQHPATLIAAVAILAAMQEIPGVAQDNMSRNFTIAGPSKTWIIHAFDLSENFFDGTNNACLHSRLVQRELSMKRWTVAMILIRVSGLLKVGLLRTMAAAFGLVWSMSAGAAFIVDTGPSDGSRGALSLSDLQYLAGQFTTSEDWIITSVEGWMFPTLGGGTGTAAIYTDGAGLPGSELFSGTFSAVGAPVSAWHGASGLDWFLPAGTYWAAFERRAGQTLSAAMLSGGVPSPMGAYAFQQPPGPWVIDPNDPTGYRIGATAADVPLPSTLVLIGPALVVLMGWRRRQANSRK